MTEYPNYSINLFREYSTESNQWTYVTEDFKVFFSNDAEQVDRNARKLNNTRKSIGHTKHLVGL